MKTTASVGLTRRRAGILTAMLVSYVPGFSLPFAAAAAIPRADADVVLLAASTAVTVGSVLGMSFENAWAASAARIYASDGNLAGKDFSAGLRQSSLLSLAMTAILFPLFSAPLFVGESDVDRGLLVLCLVSAVSFPVFGGIAGVCTGILNAQGRISTCLLLQGLRGLFPLAAIGLVASGSSAWLVSIALAVGELFRVVLAGALVGKTLSYNEKSASGTPSSRSILDHVGGLAILGSSPVIDRAFFAASGVGAVTRFEMADRVYFALNQICNNLLILPRIPMTARLLLESGVAAVTAVEVRRAVKRSGAIAVAAGGVIAVCLPFLTQELSDSALWAIVLLISLPAAVGGAVATRLLVATARSRYIPLLSIVGVSANLGGNLIGVDLYGAVGVIYSTVACRYLLLGLTLFALCHDSDASTSPSQARRE